MIPHLKMSQMCCTMSYALSTGLPGALEKASNFLELETRKDISGRRVMLQLSKPPKKKPHSLEKYAILYDYCKTDVRVEREIAKHTNSLSDKERQVWLQNVVLNHRGIRIDKIAAEKALAVVKAEKEHIKQQLYKLTEGEIDTPNKNRKLLKWCQEKDSRIQNLKEESIKEYLSEYNNDDPDSADFFINSDVITALEYRQKFARSSTSKINRMLFCLDADNRIRGLLAYHGAGTGRWAGRLFQIQNLFKPPYSERDLNKFMCNIDSSINLNRFKEEGKLNYVINWIFSMLHSELSAEEIRKKIEINIGDVLTAIASCTRGMIIADIDTKLAVVDYSNIEGRIIAWVAGEDWKIKAFEECDRNGGDMYKKSYAKIHNISEDSVTKEQRNKEAKTAELAFGFAGRIGAWRKFSNAFTDEEVGGICDKWRFGHKKIVKLWNTLEKAAIRALKNPGHTYLGSRREVPILFQYLAEEGYLVMKLPSGRHIFYPKARLEIGKFGKEGIIYETIKKSGTKKIVRFWHGMITENVVQAIAADILRYALRNLDDALFRLLFHVHDEIICALRNHETLEEMCNIMLKKAEWFKDLPMAVAGNLAERYCK